MDITILAIAIIVISAPILCIIGSCTDRTSTDRNYYVDYEGDVIYL